MKQLVFAAASAVALVFITASPSFSADPSPQYAPRYAPQNGYNYNRGYGRQGYAPRYRAGAQPQYAPQNAAPNPPNPNDPATRVSTQLSNLRAFLAQSQGGAIDPAQALGYIEKQIAPDIDFEAMTRIALGRLANRMTTQQRAAALTALRSNFTSKLVEAMGDIRATSFTVGKTRRGTSRGELVVPVRLDRWRGQPFTINFRFYQAKNGWKVFDAEAGGQSAVLFYRGYFARQWRGG